MLLITHKIETGELAGQHVCVAISSFDEKDQARAAGFTWNQIVPGAWATTKAMNVLKLIHLADVQTLERMKKLLDDSTFEALMSKARERQLSKKEQAQLVAFTLTDEKVQAIHLMLKRLAAVCDGAVAEDGMGFNGTDAPFGHDLARAPKLTKNQAAFAKIMLWKYQGQLPEELLQLVYGDDLKAARERELERAAEKERERLNGKLCRKHQRPATTRVKRSYFCDECKPVEVVAGLATTRGPVADLALVDDAQHMSPATTDLIEAAQPAGPSYTVADYMADMEAETAPAATPAPVDALQAEDQASVSTLVDEKAPEALQAPAVAHSGRAVGGFYVPAQTKCPAKWDELERLMAKITEARERGREAENFHLVDVSVELATEIVRLETKGGHQLVKVSK